MDSDPTDRRSKPAIASRIDPEDGILEITYRRRNFPVRVLVSVDARQWDEAPEEPEIVDSPEDGGLIEERLRLALPENGATLYFRLSAKLVGN